MKKGVLYSSMVGFGLVLLSVVVLTKEGDKEYYTPRQNAISNDGHAGAVEWINRMRANQITGVVDPADVFKARQQARQLASKKSASALGLTWQNMGPDDMGGRARAFLIDKNNPDVMYVGAVGGGLFKSTNGGASWNTINDMQENLAVVSIAQAANGDIYYGTGEDMYAFAAGTSNGSSGFMGGGIFKSTDGGSTFNLLTSTAPTGNSTGVEWASVGKIVCDPNNSNLIYAATNRGLRVSEDGGTTWTNPFAPTLASSQDMTIDGSGRVWVKIGSKIYKSDGTATGFTEISKSPVGIQPTDLPQAAGRSRIAVSPQDDNYVYVVVTSSGYFDKAYRSTDGGATWTIIGEKNFYLDPHAAQGNPQGNYDNAVTVDANNKDRILVGGVTFWEWTLTGGWQLTASIAGGAGFPYYVHADMHNVVWHPTKPNFVYALNDGGVFRSKDNGTTWQPISKGFVSAQYYSIGVGANGEVMGGTQDNGTIFIDPSNFYSKGGIRTPGIDFNGGVRDGDGGFAEISKLNTDVMFKEMQYGVMGRSVDGGGSYDAIYDFARMDPNGKAGSGTAEFAGFVAPFALWEKLHDPNSTDSVVFSADSLKNDYGVGGGDSVFTGSFVAPYHNKTTVNGVVINTIATLNEGGFTLDAGNRHVGYDAGTSSLTITGGTLRSGSYVKVFNDPNNNNLPTFEYKVSFDSIVKNDRVVAKLPISYNAGDKVIVKSRTNDIDLIYTLPSAANSITNPRIMVQDDVQSAFFMGLRSNSLTTPTGNPNNAGGIWMTRSALTNLTGTPQWFHIGDLFIGETPQTMAVTGDGDALYVGTTAGRLYRFSNLINARDSASADIDDFYNGDTSMTRLSTSVVQKTLVRSFSGRVITSIATHPFDNNKLVVTLGNYGNSDFVYYSNNATAAMPTLTQKDLGTSNLPDFPVYASTFNFNDPTGKQVIIGTEYGVYSTDDIEAGSVVWNDENNGLARVPVYDLVQYQTVRYDLIPTFEEGYYEGAIYAGTHGRGIFRTNTTEDYVGIKEVKPSEIAAKAKVLNVYPNPASERIFVDLSLESRTDVTITIRNINGQLVKNVTYNKLSKDIENLEIGVSNLAKGTYVITLSKGAEVISGKFIKL